MAFYDLVNHPNFSEEQKPLVSLGYNEGAAAVWNLFNEFLAATTAERRAEDIEKPNTIEGFVAAYTPESLAEAVKRIKRLRELVDFHQGDVVTSVNGKVKATVITDDTYPLGKQVVSTAGRCFDIDSPYAWRKTGETNHQLIAALDDIDVEEPGGGE